MSAAGKVVSILAQDARLLLAKGFSQPRQRPLKLDRVLVAGYAAIGDLIFFLPVLRELRRALPEARIVFLANRHAGTAELLPAMGWADEIWHVEHAELAHRGSRTAVARRIGESNFDAAILSHPTPARPLSAALLSIPVRVGHCRPLEAPHQGWSAARYAFWRLRRGLISDEFERRWTLNRPVWVAEDEEHMVSRNLRLLQALGLPPSALRDSRPEPRLTNESESAARRLLPEQPGRVTVGLHLGAPQSQYAKIWPPEAWAETCRLLARNHPLRLALFGGPDETAWVERFRAGFGGDFIDLVGKTTLLEAFAAQRHCRLFLSNDTGLAKSSMALGIPTATVWGPSDRRGYGVYWEPEKHLEIYQPLPCSPCVRMGLRAEGAGVINFSNCGHRKCLNDLRPAEVAAAIEKKYAPLLGSTA